LTNYAKFQGVEIQLDNGTTVKMNLLGRYDMKLTIIRIQNFRKLKDIRIIIGEQENSTFQTHLENCRECLQFSNTRRQRCVNK